MSKKNRNKTTEGQRLDYRARAANNRARRIKKHLKQHINDTQTEESLLDIKIRSGRKSITRNKTRLINMQYSVGNKIYNTTKKISKISQQLDRISNRNLEKCKITDELLSTNRKIFRHIIGSFKEHNIIDKQRYIEIKG